MFKALGLLVHGFARCEWSDNEIPESFGHKRIDTQPIIYSGEKDYLNVKTILQGSEGSDPVIIQSGVHRFEFECSLPYHLPESLETAHGYIRYTVEVLFDVPWKLDKKFKLPFRVRRRDDLNSEPQLKIPIHDEKIKTFYCLWCESKPLIMTVTLPFSGFTPCQTMRVTVNYLNKSSVDVVRTKIALKRLIRYNSDQPHRKTKLDSKTIQVAYCDGVSSSNFTTIEEELMVPVNVIKSNRKYCNIVEVSYELKVKAKISGCRSNIEVSFPITIGTVPLIFDSITENVHRTFSFAFTPTLEVINDGL